MINKIIEIIESYIKQTGLKRTDFYLDISNKVIIDEELSKLIIYSKLPEYVNYKIGTVEYKGYHIVIYIVEDIDDIFLIPENPKPETI